MATKLYLRHEAASLTVAGTLPSAEQSTATADASVSGAGTPKKLSAEIGSAVNRQISVTTIASASQQKCLMGIWLSEPIGANITIGTADIELSLAAAETNANANFSLNSFVIYAWDPGAGSVRGKLIDMPGVPSATGAAEAGFLSFKVAESTLLAASLSDINALAGDVLVVEVWGVFTQSSASGIACNMLYDGGTENTTNGASASNHGSFIQFGENISFNPPVEGDGAAAAVLTAAAVGTMIRQGVGSAAAVLTVAGAALNYVSGAGAAACVLSVAGVGVGIVGGVASAAAICNVTGVWDLSSVVNSGAGMASAALSAEAVGQQYFPHLFQQESEGDVSWSSEATIDDSWTAEAPLDRTWTQEAGL